jgi:hypothetical protein
MVGPWTDSCICPTQISIIVRCAGCGARFSTKNIGWRNKDTNEVTLARSLFPIFNEDCTCKNPTETPLVHDCTKDHIHYDWNTKTWLPDTEENVRKDIPI